VEPVGNDEGVGSKDCILEELGDDSSKACRSDPDSEKSTWIIEEPVASEDVISSPAKDEPAEQRAKEQQTAAAPEKHEGCRHVEILFEPSSKVPTQAFVFRDFAVQTKNDSAKPSEVKAWINNHSNQGNQTQYISLLSITEGPEEAPTSKGC